MHVFLWSGTFLLFSIGGSGIGLASLIGLPISPGVQVGVALSAAIIALSGAALVFFTASAPALVPIRLPAE